MIFLKKIYFIATAEYAVNAFLLNHIKEISKKFDITVMVNTKNPNFLKEQGLDVNVVQINMSRKINLMSDFYCLLFLFFYFFRNRPFAVHSITPKAGLLTMLAGIISFVPLRVHTFTGQVWAIKKGFYRCILKNIDWLIGFLANFAIVDSPSQCEFLIREKILPYKKTIVFGSGSVSGVNLEKFKADKNIRREVRKKLSIPYNAFVYVYLGRLKKDKGVLDLVSAFSKIHDDRAYLVVVGPDEEDLSRQFNNLLGGNQDKLRLVGFSRTPQNYLAAADVLCLPSYREGFGSVIIEAAAMGIPSIASNIYGISDAVQDNKTGLLHPPNDINAIYRCMNSFLFNPKLVKSFGLNAKKRAVNEFDAKLISKYWLEFYLNNLH